MRLTQSMALDVPQRIQERGRELYRKGRVLLLQGTELGVDAKVVGTRLYSVAIDRVDGLQSYSCTCPFYEGGAGLCKHVWAVLMAAEKAGYLTAGLEDPLQAHRPGDTNGRPPPNPEIGEAAARLDSLDRAAPRPSRWETQLREIASGPTPDIPGAWPAGRQVVYVVSAPDAVGKAQLSIEIAHRDLRLDGSWGKSKPFTFHPRLVAGLPDASDREILSMILGSVDSSTGAYGYYSGYGRGPSLSGYRLTVPGAVCVSVLPAICGTGRGFLQVPEAAGEPVPLTLDAGPAWELCVDVTATPDGGGYEVNGVLRRGAESADLAVPAFLLAGGYVVMREGRVAALQDFGAFGWISVIRRSGPLFFPSHQADDFLARLLHLHSLPRIDMPPGLAYEEVASTPRPCLRITRSAAYRWSYRSRPNQLQATLSFEYEGEVVEAGDPRKGTFKADSRRLLVRDRDAEFEARRRLGESGVRPAPNQEGYVLAPQRLPVVVRTLTDAGWRVEAEGSLYRPAAAGKMRVSSGTDWFELEGELDFGGESASLPELLAALRRGEDFVRLGDGSIGLMPEEWLKGLALAAGVGTASGGVLRFKRTQVSVLDALLATRFDVSFDEVFRQARQRLLEFGGVGSALEPDGFHGELRGYQREGLGWFGFLQEFGFGGCLADDMGLGKTVQVLALLESRRHSRTDGEPKTSKPTLVVVPRSLIFNWLEEARRFAPNLRVLDHTGQRADPGPHFDEFDVVLTTYGTLRKDAVALSDVSFDYCILDEAQAIKNGSTASAKAAGLIQADHRLALSGTPIENHLGELWSLFEFLNPGLLGSARAFQAGIRSRNPDDMTRQTLSRALRPFILRRSKEQVASDLPPKTEQTQLCDLAGAQRRQYDQLRAHYRQNLMKRVDRDGIAKSKIFVLEALLRLRQAACHPGLIDPNRATESSAKLDMLIPQLVEVAAEGHKAIVFSQFTKFLAILKARLDREGISYAYLDGRTKDRQDKVRTFQEDPNCRLFLISLKAGGLGLNLTAAEYVFLLDPWWNPAVEAQAIDRAHRIGQTLPLFAYRIIARDTVEEKVLQLQESKRALADAIITADNSLIRKIRREDLELLLS